MAKPTAAKRKSFHKKLDVFLDDFITAPEGEFPVVTTDTMRALSQVIHDLLDLKFERDTDSDMVIEFALADRGRARLNHFTVPHRPDRDDINGQVVYIDQMTRAANSATYYAKEILRMLEFHTVELRNSLANKTTKEDEVLAFAALLDNNDLKAAEKQFAILLDKYDPPKNHASSQDRGFRKIEPNGILGALVDPAHGIHRGHEVELVSRILLVLEAARRD